MCFREHSRVQLLKYIIIVTLSDVKQIREMVKDKKKHNGGAPQKKSVVGKNAARDQRDDASIEQMQKDTAAAVGLGEGTEADNGADGEKSTSPAASPPSAAPLRGTRVRMTRGQRCWQRRLPQQNSPPLSRRSRGVRQR